LTGFQRAIRGAKGSIRSEGVRRPSDGWTATSCAGTGDSRPERCRSAAGAASRGRSAAPAGTGTTWFAESEGYGRAAESEDRVPAHRAMDGGFRHARAARGSSAVGPGPSGRGGTVRAEPVPGGDGDDVMSGESGSYAAGRRRSTGRRRSPATKRTAGTSRARRPSHPPWGAERDTYGSPTGSVALDTGWLRGRSVTKCVTGAGKASTLRTRQLP